MTTPIEAGAEAVHQALSLASAQACMKATKAVFGSIERADMAREAYLSDNWGVRDAATKWDQLTLMPHEYERYFRIADAILAWLNGADK